MGIENELSLRQARSLSQTDLSPCNDCTIGEPVSCGKQIGAVDSRKRLVVLCSVKGIVERVTDVDGDEEIVAMEPMLAGVEYHPEVAQAAALLSGAKGEANALVRGNDSASVQRRLALQSRLTKDLIERSGLGSNGKPKTDRKIPEATKVAVQDN